MERDNAATHQRHTPAPESTATPASLPRRIDSKTLLGAAQEVEINHVGQIYRLRRTSLGKLILTK